MILWVPTEHHRQVSNFESEGLEDKETWRTKHMCRSLGTEIYDLAWSPDASYFIIGSMDNIARIYNAATGMSIWSVSLCAKLTHLQELLFARLPNIAITYKVSHGTH